MIDGMPADHQRILHAVTRLVMGIDKPAFSVELQDGIGLLIVGPRSDGSYDVFVSTGGTNGDPAAVAAFANGKIVSVGPPPFLPGTTLSPETWDHVSHMLVGAIAQHEGVAP